jgi:Amt family ammonium transporter
MEMINSGDTAWVLISTALVMLMTPGLAFFYGGLVRRKNILGVLMQCFAALCVLSLLWMFFGYSLSFRPAGPFIGDLGWFALKGVGGAPNPDYAATIPHSAFMIFQMMFAVITPALIIGALAERMKFSAYILFIIVWSFLVYYPVCHMVWAVGGLMREWGALDFAGGTVVHINAGIAALVASLVLGKRVGSNHMGIHHLPFAVLGAAMLWFGWFGFNAGSALGAGDLAAGAFVATHLATAAAGLSWALIEWVKNGKPTTLGVITGAVAGLVAITPAAGFVDPVGAVCIGFLSSVFCYFAVSVLKVKLGYDDTLDAFGVHGIGGIWGALATGIFAQTSVNSAGADGLLYGNPALLIIQLKAVLLTVVYSFVVTFVILKLIDVIFKARVSSEEEVAGLDLTQHHERAYTILD